MKVGAINRRHLNNLIMKKIYLSINKQEFSIYEFATNESTAEFLRKNKEHFFDKRLEIPNFLDDEAAYKKFYERASEIIPKVKEDAAVWVLGKCLSFDSLGVLNPNIGKEIIINPFGSDPTKGKSFWRFRFHSSIGGEKRHVDVDRLLFVQKDCQPLSIHNCQIYSPDSGNFDVVEKIRDKNRQLPLRKYQEDKPANTEIIFFIDKPEEIDHLRILEKIPWYSEKYDKEVRPNTFFNLILWSLKEGSIKLYRTEILP
ncbi:hypothetical protein CH373_07275 [Leptospira perolatii]|uniref:Uncharacterized protein n=1 Tax=Leptospira perolatii TaxID=2023191 RepID=A0A2M9ZPM1_9LEPT|nr:hypothetical protein [Leptospira perolatii]PJZ70720.1 hypothetical protein CH360_04135 [Leptospira perolatii]PJZ73929.1 hypothetical protein CH373_07275 [Leptospira perolatii]